MTPTTAQKQSKAWQHIVAALLCMLIFFLLLAGNLLYMLNRVTDQSFLKKVFEKSPLTEVSATFLAEEEALRQVGLDNDATVSEYILAEFLNDHSDASIEVGGGNASAPPPPKATQEELRAILDRTTLDDFVEEKMADMISSLATGQTPQGTTAEEVKDLLNENEAIIMEYTDEPIGEAVENAVDEFFTTDVGKALAEPTSLQGEESNTALRQIDEITTLLRGFTSPMLWIALFAAACFLALITVFIHSNRALGLVYGSIPLLLGSLAVLGITSLLKTLLSLFDAIPQTLQSVADAFVSVMQQTALPCAIAEITLAVVMLALAVVTKRSRKASAADEQARKDTTR